MKKLFVFAVVHIISLALIPTLAFAMGPKAMHHQETSGLFRNVGTFDVIAGNGSAVAEIVDVTVNGKQLVYTDSDNGAIGFVDISDPAGGTRPFHIKLFQQTLLHHRYSTLLCLRNVYKHLSCHKTT